MDDEESLCRIERQVRELRVTLIPLVVNTTGDGVLCRHLEQILLCVVYAVCTVRGNGMTFSLLSQYYQQFYPTSVLFQTVSLALPPTVDSQEATGSLEEFCIQVIFT